MATVFTSNLRLALPTNGTESGTWGDTVNNGITSLTDTAIAGTATITMTAADYTLSTANGAADEARSMFLKLTGTPGAARNVICPASSKMYGVYNNTTGGFAITLKTASGTGISVPNGAYALLYCDGTNVVAAESYKPALALGTALPVSSGGTGATVGVSGGVLGFTGTGTAVSSAALAANNVVIGGGAGATPTSTNLLTVAPAVTTGNYMKGLGYADTVVALGNTGTAINLDVTAGGVFTATLTGNATITLRYPVASGASSFTLILTNGAGGPFTVAWAGGSFKFPGGAASLTRSTAASAIDVWFFFTPDAGTTWYGSIPMKALAT